MITKSWKKIEKLQRSKVRSLREIRKLYKKEDFHSIFDNFESTYNGTLYFDPQKVITFVYTLLSPLSNL